MNLHVPTPWALVRYLPIVDQARAPARFKAVVAMGVAALAVLALCTLLQRMPQWRGRLVTGFGLLLLFELWPAPRPLYSAVIPPVYDIIAADARDVRVLELSFGVRDGLSSIGDFNASARFNQTRHGKRLIGGYLSRVSPQRLETIEHFPVLRALMTPSAGAPLLPGLAEHARDHAAGFVRDARVSYVVVARKRASRELVDFAVRTLDLELVAESETRALYRPRQSALPAWTASAMALPAGR